MSKNEKTHHLPLEATLLAHDLLRQNCVRRDGGRAEYIGPDFFSDREIRDHVQKTLNIDFDLPISGIRSIRVKTIGRLIVKKRPKNDKALFLIRRLYDRTGQNFQAAIDAIDAYNEKYGQEAEEGEEI